MGETIALWDAGMPRAVFYPKLEISPFHGSVYFTNVGSLGIKPVFHHL